MEEYEAGAESCLEQGQDPSYFGPVIELSRAAESQCIGELEVGLRCVESKG